MRTLRFTCAQRATPFAHAIACVALSVLDCRYAATKDWASMLVTVNSIPFHLEKKMGKRGQVAGRALYWLWYFNF